MLLTLVSFAALLPVTLAARGDHVDTEAEELPALRFGAPLPAGTIVCARVVFRYELTASGARGPGRVECASGASSFLAVEPLLANLALTLAPLAILALRLGAGPSLLAVPALVLTLFVPFPAAWDPLGEYREWFPLARPWAAVWLAAMVLTITVAALWRLRADGLARRLLSGRA